jgi:Tol biopolymer transport system component
MASSRLRVARLLPVLAVFTSLANEPTATSPPQVNRTTTYTTLQDLAPTQGFDRHDPSNVFRHEDRYWTFYTHNENNHQTVAIHLASSPDGYNWTDHGIALGPGKANAWDESGTIAPYCVLYKNQFHLFYTGFQQNNLATRQLGCAIAPHPKGPWKRLPQNPLLQQNPDPKAWDSGMLGDSNPVLFQNQWWLYYKSRRHNETSRDTHIGVAISDNLTGPYTRHPANPLFTGHAFSIWPQDTGLGALCGVLSPNTLFSSDGIHFHPTGTLTNHSTGLFTPPAEIDPEHQYGLTWGLDVYAQQGTRGLRRFDVHQPKPEIHKQAAHSPLIGFTRLRTNLPGGRHANIRTSRAMVTNTKGDTPVELAPQLIDDPNAWTQFSGWSPDGSQAILIRGWENPANAEWEEQNKRFRMNPGQWLLDTCLLNPTTGQLQNLTAIHRVSHYNSGLFFLPDNQGFGFTALQNQTSVPFLMNPDGSNKHPVPDSNHGFAYGYSASPDGSHLSFHADYQVYIASRSGTSRQHIQTGNPFNFGPAWSPDGEWLLFLSGTRGNSHPHVVRKDGSGLRQIANLNNYQGWVLFLDVPDYHEGSSDLPAWSRDSRSIFYAAQTSASVELFQTTLNGNTTQLTHSTPGTLHYHPTPSPDGHWLAYGSQRDGLRQLYLLHLATSTETLLTRPQYGYAAMWPHWQPNPAKHDP